VRNFQPAEATFEFLELPTSSTPKSGASALNPPTTPVNPPAAPVATPKPKPKPSVPAATPAPEAPAATPKPKPKPMPKPKAPVEVAPVDPPVVIGDEDGPAHDGGAVDITDEVNAANPKDEEN
jgi:hypothetical protein